MEMDENTRDMIHETHDAVTEMRPVIKSIHKEQKEQAERVRQLELNERELSTKQEQTEEDVEHINGKVNAVSASLSSNKEKQSGRTEDRFWKLTTIILSVGGVLLGVGHLALAIVNSK